MTNSDTATDHFAWGGFSKWIRIVGELSNGMIEFEFAVGEPQLFVEMLLPRPAFEDFCALQDVTPTVGHLPESAAGSVDHEWDWNLQTARSRHFRHEADD